MCRESGRVGWGYLIVYSRSLQKGTSLFLQIEVSTAGSSTLQNETCFDHKMKVWKTGNKYTS